MVNYFFVELPGFPEARYDEFKDTAAYRQAVADYKNGLRFGEAHGTDGIDDLMGSLFNDILFGYAGDDTMYGEEGHDTLHGGDGNDNMYGYSGDDVLKGGRGKDWLDGHDGDDHLYGGRNRDRLEGGEGDDHLYGGRAADWLDGGSGNDVLRGQRGDDRLSGEAGDDFLHGGAGDDRLLGYSGDDTLNGGRGDDYLWGGSGADTFVFSQANSGHDKIEDFNQKLVIKRLKWTYPREEEGDKIVFRGEAAPDSFDDLTLTKKKARDSDTTPGTLITWGDGTNSIFLDDLPPQRVQEEDFIFA
ncbi:MAG: calcium-binding protein [Rhodobacteraceae bacterium]|nr:calcium-binding protein [Paracoccaceae bacterium]